jgi:hypothetical protein
MFVAEQRVVQNAKGLVSDELRQRLRVRISEIRSVSASLGSEETEREYVSLLERVPCMGHESAASLLRMRVGDIRQYPDESAQSRFDRILQASRNDLKLFTWIGELKATTVYEALDFARFDLYVLGIKTELEERIRSGGNKDEIFEALRGLGHFLRTGKHMEND